jgi:hypothetical protein
MPHAAPQRPGPSTSPTVADRDWFSAPPHLVHFCEIERQNGSWMAERPETGS